VDVHDVLDVLVGFEPVRILRLIVFDGLTVLVVGEVAVLCIDSKSFGFIGKLTAPF
jgi:hypothetical protein